MDSTRSFKIRKTMKNKSTSDVHDLEEVTNLKDLRLADDFDQEREKPKCN